jgi:hypothetical protein
LPLPKTNNTRSKKIKLARELNLAPERTALRVELIADVIDELPLQALAGLREY